MSERPPEPLTLDAVLDEMERGTSSEMIVVIALARISEQLDYLIRHKKDN